MLQRLLVPTDGSPESEKALGVAELVARAQGAEVLLVHVLELSRLAFIGEAEGPGVAEVYAEATQQLEDEAKAQLAALETRLSGAGVRARGAVLQGPIAGTLLDFEASERPDLVVMATHGRSALVRFALGSVTDSLIREGTTPVLVIRRTTPLAGTLERALIMLDGSPVAEEALPILESLAGKPIRSVVLFRAINDPTNRERAVAYLDGVATRLKAAGLATENRVEVGQARQLTDQVTKDVDLVVLCTHGRSGFDRLRHGSVAEHVIRELDKPALLVRAGAAQG